MAALQSAREKNLYLAKLAQQAERHKDMVAFMEKVSASISHTEELTTEERYLLSIAYKNLLDTRRASWRIINLLDSRKPAHVSAIRDYTAKIESDISSICSRIINLLDSRLIKSASTGETKVYYMKMKGDYYRYLAEFKTGEQRKEAAEKTLAAYEAAQEIAKSELDPAHPVLLGLALNFSVFYYDIMDSGERAFTLAKMAYEEGIEDLDPVEESTYRDSISILQRLRDNIVLWASNLQDGDGDDDDDEDSDDGEDRKINFTYENGTTERVDNSG